MLRLRPHGLRLGMASAFMACLLAVPRAEAAPVRAKAKAAQPAKPRGRPDVKLDRLDFPMDVPGARLLQRQLRLILKREARRADWGAGRGSKIEYRFAVTELSLERDGDVLRVRCTAVGKLPGGKTARSNLTFGGEPAKRNQTVARVLEIVARGVITRLAELERIRRGDLDKSRVRAALPDPD